MSLRTRRAVALAALALIASSLPALAQQTATSFTYQGRLDNNGLSVGEKLDISFTLFNDDVGGMPVSDSLIKTLTPVDGLFTTELDFGAEALIGDQVWLEIEIQPYVGFPEVLSPRQRITPAPAAVQSGAITQDGSLSVIDPVGLTTEVATYIDNTGTPQDSTFAPTFWQSFRTTQAQRLELFEILVKRPAGAPAAVGRLYRGEGPGGQFIESLREEWGATAPGGLQLMRYTPIWPDPRDAVLLDADETYTMVFETLPEDQLTYMTLPITDPNAGRSSAGATLAASFQVDVATEVDPAAFFDGSELTVTRLNVDSSDGQGSIWLESTFPGVLIRDTDTRSFFGNGDDINITLQHTRTENPFTESYWRLKATPEALTLRKSDAVGALPEFEYSVNPLPRAWFSVRRIGMTEAALEGDDVILEDTDAVLGLYSNEGGSFGSTVVLGQVDDTGLLLDKWSMSRRTTGSNELQFAFGTNANYGANQINLALRADGSAWLRGALTQNSTATEKHDIETLTGAIDTLLALRGVSYAWNDTDKPDIGFIAEEMAVVLPEIVGFDEHGKPIGIDYGRVTALIVEATKAQQRQLDEQGDLIRELTRRLEALERRED